MLLTANLAHFGKANVFGGVFKSTNTECSTFHFHVTCSEGHTQACGETCDGKNVIEAACSHQQGGDSLLNTITLLLQQQHGRNDHCWRHSAQDKATGQKGWILKLFHLLLQRYRKKRLEIITKHHIDSLDACLLACCRIFKIKYSFMITNRFLIDVILWQPKQSEYRSDQWNNTVFPSSFHQS